ncbi:conserved Plasmodium protein, unknown function [Plasmodium relictum]|uniref:Uncharacterized protein n=1 Tax=Plasmodium relictum TaxID=85471 RepID=A0A1J1HA28_PLARL|nr:conserved Plasmodium protein, unknown function [Plasmodium relictum]CRH00282.1 conserved Plasmodium protein, unknown function [Plasmodium relictum]
MTQLKKKFINCDTNENTSSLCEGTTNIYNEPNSDEYRKCEPENIITECVTPKFKNMNTKRDKIRIKIQKDWNLESPRNLRSGKKNKSFIKNIVKKMEDIYKNGLHNKKKNNKLLFDTHSMIFPNEYLNAEPTNNVLYRRRTPHETLLRSDFNGINLKPFVRFKSVGNLDNRMKNKAIIKISNINPYGIYENNKGLNYFNPTSLNTSKYISSSNMDTNGGYMNNRCIYNHMNCLSNRINRKTLSTNRHGTYIKRNTMYDPFYSNHIKNMKYKELGLNSCNSYNFHDLKKHNNNNKTNNKINLKIRSNEGNKEEYLDDISGEINSNKMPLCDHNISCFNKENISKNNFPNQDKKLRAKISIPLSNYSNHIEKNEENIYNSNFNNENIIKRKQDVNEIKFCYGDNSTDNSFQKNHNNYRNINYYNSDHQYHNKNSRLGLDKKNSQIAYNENNIRVCDNSLRNDINLKYAYNDKSCLYNEKNKKNRNSSINLKKKEKKISKDSIKENENLNSDEEKKLLKMSATNDKINNNSFDKCEKAFNESHTRELHKTSSNSRKNLENDIFHINNNIDNCKINKSYVQVEDKKSSRISNFDNNDSDKKIIKKSFSNQIKSSNKKIILYGDINNHRNMKSDIDYRIIKDKNSKEDTENYMGNRRRLYSKNYIHNNSQDYPICDHSVDSKEKYGNLRTMTIVSDCKRLCKEEKNNKENPVKNKNNNSKKYSFHKKSKIYDSEYHLNSDETNSNLENCNILEYNMNNKYKLSDTNNKINCEKMHKSSQISKKNKRNYCDLKQVKSNKVYHNRLLEIEDKKNRSGINSYKYENGYKNSNEIIDYNSRKSRTKSSLKNKLNKAITLKNKESSSNESDYNNDYNNHPNREIDEKNIYAKKNFKDNTHSMKIKKKNSKRSKSENFYDYKAIKDNNDYYSSGSINSIFEEKIDGSSNCSHKAISNSFEKKKSNTKKVSNESPYGFSIYSSKNRTNTVHNFKHKETENKRNGEIIDENKKNGYYYLNSIKKSKTKCCSCDDFIEKEKNDISLGKISRRKIKGINNLDYSSSSSKGESLQSSELSNILTDEDYEEIKKSKTKIPNSKSNKIKLSTLSNKSQSISNINNIEVQHSLCPEKNSKINKKKSSVNSKRSYITNNKDSSSHYYSKIGKMNSKYSHYSTNKCLRKNNEKNNRESSYNSEINTNFNNDFEIKSQNRKVFKNLSKHHYLRNESKQNIVKSLNNENIIGENLDDMHNNICKHSILGSKHSSEKIIETYSFNDRNSSAYSKNSNKNSNKDYINDNISNKLNSNSNYTNTNDNKRAYNKNIYNNSYAKENIIKEKEFNNNSRDSKENNYFTSELDNENNSSIKSKESINNNNMYVNTYEIYKYNTLDKVDSYISEKSSSKVPYACNDEELYNRKIDSPKLKIKSNDKDEFIRSKRTNSNGIYKETPYLKGSKKFCEFMNNRKEDKNIPHEKMINNTKREYSQLKNIDQSLVSFPEDCSSLKNIKKNYLNNEDYDNCSNYDNDSNVVLYREKKKMHDSLYSAHNNSVNKDISFQNKRNESSINLPYEKNTIESTYENKKKYMNVDNFLKKSNFSTEDLNSRKSKKNRSYEKDINLECTENFSNFSKTNRNIIEHNKSYGNSYYSSTNLPQKKITGEYKEQKSIKCNISPNNMNHKKKNNGSNFLYNSSEYMKTSNNVLNLCNQDNKQNNAEITENGSLLNKDKISMMNTKSSELLEKKNRKKGYYTVSSEYYNKNNLSKNYKLNLRDEITESLYDCNGTSDDRNLKRESNYISPSCTSRKQYDEETLQKIKRTMSQRSITGSTKRENRKKQNYFSTDYNNMDNLNNDYNNLQKNYNCHYNNNVSVNTKNESLPDNYLNTFKRSKSCNLREDKNNYIRNYIDENNNSLNYFHSSEDHRSNKNCDILPNNNKKEIYELNDRYNNSGFSKNNNANESTKNYKGSFNRRFSSENSKKKRNEIINCKSDESLYSKSESENNFNLFYVERLSYKKGLSALLPKIVDAQKRRKHQCNKKNPENDNESKIQSHNRNDHSNRKYRSMENIKNDDIKKKKIYEDNNVSISSYISNENKQKLINAHNISDQNENSTFHESMKMNNLREIYRTKMNQTINHSNNNISKDSRSLHLKKNNNISERNSNYSKNYINSKNTYKTRNSKDNNTFENINENKNNSKYNISFNIVEDDTRSQVISNENDSKINNNFNSSQIEINNQIKTSMNDYFNNPIESNYSLNSKKREVKNPRRKNEGLNIHASNSNIKRISNNGEYFNKENEILSKSFYSYIKKSENNDSINLDLVNTNSLNKSTKNFNSEKINSKQISDNHTVYSYKNINKEDNFKESISLNDNMLYEMKRTNNEESLNNNSSSYEIEEKTTPSKNYSILPNEEDRGIPYISSDKKNSLKSDVIQIVEKENPTQVISYEENINTKSIYESNRNKENNPITQTKRKTNENLNVSEFPELFNLNDLKILNDKNSTKNKINSTNHHLYSMNNDNNKSSHGNSLNGIVGIVKANEYMKNQLNYYLENDNEINKNSKTNSKKIESNINIKKKTDIYNSNIENSDIPSPRKGINDSKDNIFDNINNEKKNISFLYEEGSKISTTNLNKIKNETNNSKVVNTPYSSLNNNESINSYGTLYNLNNNNTIHYQNENNSIHNEIFSNIKVPSNNGNSTCNMAFTHNSIPITNNIPVNNGIPITNSIPVNNGIPITNSIPVNNGIPITNSVPVNNGIPITSSIPVNNGIPITNSVLVNNGIPITNNIPINNSIPIANNIPVNTRIDVNSNAPNISLWNNGIDNSFCLNGGGNIIKYVHANEKKKNNLNNSGINILRNYQLNKNDNITIYDNLNKNETSYNNHLTNKTYNNNNLINKNIFNGNMINQKSIISTPASHKNLNDQHMANYNLINNNCLSRMCYDNNAFSTININNQNLSNNLVNHNLKNNDINSILVNRNMSYNSSASAVKNSSSCNNVLSENLYKNYLVQNNPNKKNSVNCSFTNLNNNQLPNGNVNNQSLCYISNGKPIMTNITNMDNHHLNNNNSMNNIGNYIL